MSYLLQTRKKKRNPFPKLIAILVVCFLLGFVLRSFFIKTFTYVGGGLGSVVSFVMPNGFRSDTTIKEENDKLRSEISKLTAENADRNILKSENDNLKFILNRKSKTASTSKEILAIILSKPSETPYDTFILDAGTSEGVILNDKVIYGSLAIGNIVEVGDGYSKAKLFSSPGNVFSGTLGEDDIKVEVKGLGGGGFYALVPISSKSEVGDALIMPNISSKVYGVVQRVEELTAEGFKKLYFVMPINPNQINEVLIEK